MCVCWQHYTGKWLCEAVRERAGWIREALAAPPRSGIRRRLRFCERPLGLRQSERWRRRFICWRRPHRVGAAAAAAAGCSRFGGPGGGCAAYRIGSSNACHCAREPLGRRRRWRWKAPSAANVERQARTEPRMNPSLRLAQARRFCQLACRPLKRESSRMLQQRRRRWRWRRLKQRELQPELSRTAMNATTSQPDRQTGWLSIALSAALIHIIQACSGMRCSTQRREPAELQSQRKQQSQLTDRLASEPASLSAQPVSQPASQRVI